MLTMNLEGLEMIAVLVVVVLFVKVLERFGLLADSYDGKESANSFHVWEGCFFFCSLCVANNHLLPKFKTTERSLLGLCALCEFV